MLSTDLSTFLPVLVIGLLAVIVMFQGLQIRNLTERCDTAINYVMNENKRSVSLRRIAEVEATLTDLLDSYQSLLTSHKRLRSRIGMREHRKKRPGGSDDASLGHVPTDEVEKARYKAQLRADMKAKGLL